MYTTFMEIVITIYIFITIYIYIYIYMLYDIYVRTNFMVTTVTKEGTKGGEGRNIVDVFDGHRC
jgi:hypothetical protein